MHYIHQLKKAFSYELNHWRALQNVSSDGRLEVDNNTAERAIRSVVVGRKNCLLCRWPGGYTYI